MAHIGPVGVADPKLICHIVTMHCGNLSSRKLPRSNTDQVRNF